MAYTIDDFPITTEDPQIEVDLPVGTHVLELIVEDSAGIKSLPDTVIITVEKEDVPDTTITGITPSSFLQGATVNAFIAGTGLAEATGVTVYTQLSIIKPPVTIDPGLLTPDITRPIITRPVITRPVLIDEGATIPLITKPTAPVIKPIKVVDSTITAVITSRSAEGIGVRLTLSNSSATGTRTFAVTLHGGVVSSGAVTFNVVVHPTITIPTITIPTLTIPTLTIPTLTIPTITIPTLTIPTVTHPTITIPTITMPTLTIPTVTHPTITIPTITMPTLTIPTVTHPTITMPTMTIPTITKPTVVIPTVVIPPVIPVVDGPDIHDIPVTPIHLATLPLTAVKGVGKAIATKLEAAGITSVSALAKATSKKVADILGYSDPARAKALIDEAAKMIK